MMIPRTGRFQEGGAVYAAFLAMAMAMTMARMRRTLSAVTIGPGQAWEEWIGRGMGWGKGRRG